MHLRDSHANQSFCRGMMSIRSAVPAALDSEFWYELGLMGSRMGADQNR